jgi:hypothetical protein
VSSPPPGDNPYAAPLSQTGASDALVSRDVNRGSSHVAWVLVFLGNLIVPLLCGWQMTGSGGHVGIVLAIVPMWCLGHYVVDSYRTVRGPLLAGGLCVGLSQVVPVIQVIAGLVGVGIASRMFHDAPPGQDPDIGLTHLTEPGAFVATLVTGALLLVAAAVLGLLLRITLRSLGWLKDGRDEPVPAI